jgi:hypothetical protein
MMDSSLAKSVEVCCAACDLRYGAELWVIVDVVARRDLREQIVGGQINCPRCPQCGQGAEPVAGPLLVCRAGQSPELLFAAAGLAADQRRELGRLAQELLTRLGRVGEEDWVGVALRRVGRRDLGEAVLLPSLMLKQGDTRFLDDLTVADVAAQLKTPILPVEGIEGLIQALVPVISA